MAYRLTKFFLYLTLSICVIWGAIILLGPRLINYAVDHYFGQSVKISGLEVSPKLQVYAARVDYIDAEIGSLGRFNGYSRAVSMRLGNLTSLNPNLHISLGPSKLGGLFEFNELISRVSYSQSETLDILNIVTQIKGFTGKSLIFEQLEAEAIIGPTRSKIRSLQYNLQNIKATLPVNISAPNMVGELVDVTLDNHAVKSFQIASNNLVRPTVFDNSNGDQLSSRNVSVTGNYDDQTLKYSMRFDEIMGNNGVFAKDVVISSTYDAKAEKPQGRYEFKSEAVYLGKATSIFNGGSISNLSGSAEFLGSNLYSLQVDGQLNSFTIENEGTFLVQMPDGHLTVKSQLPDQKAKNDIEVAIALDTNDRQKLFIEANLGASFERDSVMNCIYNKCQISKLSVHYSINIMNSIMTGQLDCKTTDCLGSRFFHRVETENTAEFFNAVSTAKLVNPMLLTYIYTEIMRGQKEGQGHIKDF